MASAVSNTGKGSKHDAEKKNLGRTGESLVVEMLSSLGWQILERNWRCGRYAEIDVIALDDQTVVFVEVKTRKRKAAIPHSLLGFESVDWKKRRKIINSAHAYLSDTRRSGDTSCRFDVVVVFCDAQPSYKLIHVRNAFVGH